MADDYSDPARVLDDDDQYLISIGRSPKGGNGSAPSFDELPPKTLGEYRERAAVIKRTKRELKQLSELEAFASAHREKMAEVYGGKFAIIAGLFDEMTVRDPFTSEPVIDADGNVTLDTTQMDDKRLGLLFKMLEQTEKVAFQLKEKGESTVNVKVSVWDHFADSAVDADVIEDE